LKNHNELFRVYNTLIENLDILTKLKIKKETHILKQLYYLIVKILLVSTLLDDNFSIRDRGFKIVFYIGKELNDNRVKLVSKH